MCIRTYIKHTKCQTERQFLYMQKDTDVHAEKMYMYKILDIREDRKIYKEKSKTYLDMQLTNVTFAMFLTKFDKGINRQKEIHICYSFRILCT